MTHSAISSTKSVAQGVVAHSKSAAGWQFYPFDVTFLKFRNMNDINCTLNLCIILYIAPNHHNIIDTAYIDTVFASTALMKTIRVNKIVRISVFEQSSYKCITYLRSATA